MIPKPLLISRLMTLFFTVLLFQANLAAAQEVPEDSLMVDFTNCMTGCLNYEGRFGCEVMCGCTVERFKTELDEAGYIELSRQLSDNEISPENRAFLDETANMCVAEMDRVMAELGLDKPADTSKLPPPEEGGDEDQGEGGGGR